MPPREADAGRAACEASGGGLRLRTAAGHADVIAAQRFRARAFDLGQALDEDPFDAAFTHVLIEDATTGAIRGTFRMRVLRGQEVETGYAARFYDLAALRSYPHAILEIGRFCVSGGAAGALALRLAWAGLAAEVRRRDIGLLIGCTSFPGTDPHRFAAAFALLHMAHLGPAGLAPRTLARDVHVLAKPPGGVLCHRSALRQMPSLLRSYLAMGAWVSDHAVVDRSLGTLHVFTGLEVAAVPPARRRSLEACGMLGVAGKGH